MSEPNQFRHYQIVQDADGNNVELVRNTEQVAVLAFDTRRLEFVHCHVLLHPLADRPAFEEACGRLRKTGHPLLARMVEFGEDEGNPFYITGNVDGETLRAYLGRQQEIPMWLAVMTACRSLEAAMALCERGDYLTDQPVESFRIVQTGPQSVQVLAGDFRLIDGKAMKNRALKSSFERQAKFLRSFLQEHAGGPTAAETMLPSVDFGELLGGCLTAMGAAVTAQVKELRNSLLKVAPEHLSGEIPTAQKPRALVAPLLASYQEVARGLVNLVRIQSQRLDMANPYSMKGTLTRAGRQVWVEQVPPRRVCGPRVEEADRLSLKLGKKRDAASLVPVVLVNESEGLTCMAEEVSEGISLAELLRERRGLDAQEAYLVLAGLDAAVSQLEKAALPTRKLRLEDIFLSTGLARDDSRLAKLLMSKLNEWPTFSVTVRAHPTLASMSGRGTDPGTLLPATPGDANGKSIWNAGWMAAVGRFLLDLEFLNGRGAVDSGNRERETVARLLDDEIAKARDGIVSSRADFLARYARVVQHYDLVKPIGAETEIAGKAAKAPAPKPVKKKLEAAPVLQASAPVSGALTAGMESPAVEKPNVGFAEILFQATATQAVGSAVPDSNWEKPSPATTWMPEGDPVPLWLKAAVFLGGSMVAGGVWAHLSGEAFWLKTRLKPTVPVVGKPVPGASSTTTPAAKVPLPELPPLKVPELKMPPPSPPNLSLKPPAGAKLRDLITESPGDNRGQSNASGTPPSVR